MNLSKTNAKIKALTEAGQAALRQKDYAAASRSYLDASALLHAFALESEDKNLKELYEEYARTCREKAFTYAPLARPSKARPSSKPATSSSKPTRSESSSSSASPAKPNAGGTNWEPIHVHPVHLDDIAGLDQAKKILTEKAILPMLDPEKAKRFKRTAGGGILLYGLPGTGKTMFAQAAATELDCPFYFAKASLIKGMYVGETEKAIESLFAVARKQPLSVIFIDEIDDLALSRSQHGSAYNGLNTLLQCINGLDDDPDHRILLIAATNRPWDVDSAMLSRLPYRIEIGLPDEEAREAMLRKKLEGIPGAEDLDYDRMVEMTKGFNGRDINAFVEAVTSPSYTSSNPNAVVSKEDVEKEGAKVHSSVRKEDVERLARYRESNS